MGDSVMTTCFVQSKSWAEYPIYRVLLLLPLVIFTPLILGAMSYTFFKYNQRYKKFITRHIAVVVVFSLAWFPVALLHFWNARIISGYPPVALKEVIARQIACILGAFSGFLTVAVQVIIAILQRSRRRTPSIGSVHAIEDTALESLTMDRT